MGFNDEELALTIFEIGQNCKKYSEFDDRIHFSTLKSFEFAPEFIFDLWGVIDDWRCDRLSNTNYQNLNNNFIYKKNSSTQNQKTDKQIKLFEPKLDKKQITNDLIKQNTYKSQLGDFNDNLPLPPPPPLFK